eukprot:COSAG03_NODE_26122_length_261_cov_0.641975_1_plen_62_part_10
MQRAMPVRDTYASRQLSLSPLKKAFGSTAVAMTWETTPCDYCRLVAAASTAMTRIHSQVDRW